MTTHTPSPWDTRKGAYGVLHVGPAMLAHPGREAAQYAADRGRDLLAQREADAALIAAAPDLLDLCERLLGFAYHYGSTEAVLSAEGLFVSARETIAKAKGGAA
jgi:hypothetical protein